MKQFRLGSVVVYSYFTEGDNQVFCAFFYKLLGEEGKTSNAFLGYALRDRLSDNIT